jgi:hypothetical protein
MNSKPYSDAYSLLKEQLRSLFELNKELPASIEKIAESSLEKWAAKVGQLAPNAQQVVEGLLDWMKKNVTTDSFQIDQFKDLLKNLDPKTVEVMRDFLALSIRLGDFNSFIRDMGLVYGVIQVENFLKRILSASFENWPGSVGDKTIRFEQLVNCSDIDQAKNLVVEEKVNSIMYEDIENIGRFMELWGVYASKVDKWKDFTERFYRRNILVHNDGMPSQIYRTKTGYTGPNNRLDVSREYLKESVDLFLNVSKSISDQFISKIDDK